MKLSVIILNYNVRYFLEQTIISVQRATAKINAEIIVIDNNSSDDSCKMMQDRFPDISLIQNKDNVGFSKANNQAVKEATGEYICILNPDTAVSEDTFIQCIDFAEANPKMGALGVYMVDGTGNFLPESKRNIPTPTVSLLKLLGFTKKYYANDVEPEARGEVAVLAGAFMFLKRELYNKVGGLDEDYFMYGEDIDLSYKITKAGYKNHYLGTTEILHYKGESTQKDAVYFERFYGAMKIFYKKHFNDSALLNKFVEIAVSLAKKNKSKQVANKKNIPSSIRQAYIFTENLSLYRQLSETLEVEIKSVSKSLFDDDGLKNCLFIFDVDYMPYSQILSIMKKYKNRENQFRIRPSRCNFILGSDQSDEKGVVIVF